MIMQLVIGPNGRVTGNLGHAEFAGSWIHSFKTIPFLIFNRPFDFEINGSLKGPVFPSDTLKSKEIVALVQRKDSVLKVVLFQKVNLNLPIMARFQLIKQE
jgi:hypothetical protein